MLYGIITNEQDYSAFSFMLNFLPRQRVEKHMQTADRFENQLIKVFAPNRCFHRNVKLSINTNTNKRF